MIRVLMIIKGRIGRLSLAAGIVVACMLLAGIYSSPEAVVSKQKTFSSADEAVNALVAAVRAHDSKQLSFILGPGSSELISSGDDVADRNGREKFLRAYDQTHSLSRADDQTMVLQVGPDNWPMPIPIAKKSGAWLFDISKGRKEILSRRIGRNELNVIEVLQAYVDAQQEYASKNCSGSGKVEFASRLTSSEGKRDGLYWFAKEGEQQSPLGPLMSRAAREGYSNPDLSPYHGYYFRILKGQGKHAEGGAYQYLVKGRMLLGFGMVAYPAEYGNSGVMTFIVNQEGTVYEKDLGSHSRKIAGSMKIFDPDKTWRKVKEAAKQPQ